MSGAAIIGCSLVLFVFVTPLRSHDPITTKLTWSQEISRIVYKRCASCHRPDGAAMSLLTYQDARPWAKAIRDQVLARQMPPWGAVKGIGDFRDDPSLSQPELDMFVAWVEGGAPEGNPAYLPSRIPDPPKPARSNEPSYARALTISKTLKLSEPSVLLAIRPKGIDDGGSLEFAAELPGGEVEQLIWLRDYRKEWTRTYVLREPLKLPASSVLRVAGSGSTEAIIYLQ